MRWRTFERLTAEHEAFVGESLARTARWLGIVNATLDGVEVCLCFAKSWPECPQAIGELDHDKNNIQGDGDTKGATMIVRIAVVVVATILRVHAVTVVV